MYIYIYVSTGGRHRALGGALLADRAVHPLQHLLSDLIFIICVYISTYIYIYIYIYKVYKHTSIYTYV